MLSLGVKEGVQVITIVVSLHGVLITVGRPLINDS